MPRLAGALTRHAGCLPLDRLQHRSTFGFAFTNAPAAEFLARLNARAGRADRVRQFAELGIAETCSAQTRICTTSSGYGSRSDLRAMATAEQHDVRRKRELGSRLPRSNHRRHHMRLVRFDDEADIADELR